MLVHVYADGIMRLVRSMIAGSLDFRHLLLLILLERCSRHLFHGAYGLPYEYPVRFYPMDDIDGVEFTPVMLHLSLGNDPEQPVESIDRVPGSKTSQVEGQSGI